MASPDLQSMAIANDGPLRRCIVSGQSLDPSRMIRFVAAPDGMIMADIDGRLPGRGIWLGASRQMIETACRKRLFAKAAKAQVRVPDALALQVEGLLARRCLNLVALARRAGEAVGGAEKVRSWLKAGRAGLLLLAADGSPDEIARMRSLAPGSRKVDILRAGELGGIFGRDRTVYAAVVRGGLADRIEAEAARLTGFRPRPPAKACNDHFVSCDGVTEE